MADSKQTIPQPPGWMEAFLEKHGVATFILLVGGWWATKNVVEPMVRSADTFIRDIREVNVEMEKAYLESLAETRQRYDQVWDVLSERREQIKEIGAKLDQSNKSHESAREEINKVLRELEKHRMLFTQPSGRPMMAEEN
jgi:vacuolar-type H+-ATPase subunit H